MRVRAVAVGTLVVLMVSVGVSSAATFPAGTYAGRTSQSQGTISFKVSGGKITRIAFVDGTEVGKGCASVGAPAPQYPVKFTTHIELAKGGHFSATAAPRQDEVFKIAGKLKGATVVGSFTDSIPIGQDTGKGFTCKSGKVTYSATRT